MNKTNSFYALLSESVISKFATHSTFHIKIYGWNPAIKNIRQLSPIHWGDSPLRFFDYLSNIFFDRIFCEFWTISECNFLSILADNK